MNNTVKENTRISMEIMFYENDATKFHLLVQGKQ